MFFGSLLHYGISCSVLLLHDVRCCIAAARVGLIVIPGCHVVAMFVCLFVRASRWCCCCIAAAVLLRGSSSAAVTAAVCCC